MCIDYTSTSGAANSVIYDCTGGSTASVAGSTYNQAKCAGSGTCFYLTPASCNKNTYTAQGGSQVVPGTDVPYEALACTAGSPAGPTPCPTNRPAEATPLSTTTSIIIIVVVVVCCCGGVGACFYCYRRRNLQNEYAGGAFSPNVMPQPGQPYGQGYGQGYGQPFGAPMGMMTQQGHRVMGDDGQAYYNSTCAPPPLARALQHCVRPTHLPSFTPRSRPSRCYLPYELPLLLTPLPIPLSPCAAPSQMAPGSTGAPTGAAI